MSRQPLLGIVVGKKGVGKTFTTNKLIFNYITGRMGLGAPPRKVLILDVNDEFTHVPAIAVSDVIKFSGQDIIEARRIRRMKPNGVPMTIDEVVDALRICIDYFRGGLLLLEDTNKYITENVPGDLNGALCGLRHVDTDVILHYQGLGAIPPKMWRNFNWIRYHKCSEFVKDEKDKFKGRERDLSVVEALVNHEFDKGGDGEHFYVYYEEKDDKIRGAYSQKMLYNAILIYLEENYNSVIKPHFNRFDIRSGSYKKPEPQKVVQEVASKLFKDLYGGSMPIAA